MFNVPKKKMPWFETYTEDAHRSIHLQKEIVNFESNLSSSSGASQWESRRLLFNYELGDNRTK